MILTLDRENDREVDEDPGKARSPVVRRLILNNFRSYTSLRIETDARPVVLTGSNGAGKTNLLEAVSLLAPGRGLRKARIRNLDRLDGGAWSIAAKVQSHHGVNEIGTGRSPENQGSERRLVRINGMPATSQAALADLVSVLWLTPAMDRLFQEGSGERRRFLDRLVLTNDPAHVGRVTSYHQALRERNRLLRSSHPDPSWLSAIEVRAASSAIAIAAARRQTVQALSKSLAMDPTPFPRPMIELEGDVESWLQDLSALDAEQRLTETFIANRRKDAETGTTAAGPHRSDLIVHDANSGMPAKDCSTGQQKALLISICLAEARRRAALYQPLPILLLDEVAAHLDSQRRQDLFDELAKLDLQAWLTGTDASVFAPFGQRAQYFTVNSSELHPYDVN